MHWKIVEVAPNSASTPNNAEGVKLTVELRNTPEDIAPFAIRTVIISTNASRMVVFESMRNLCEEEARRQKALSLLTRASQPAPLGLMNLDGEFVV